MLAFFFGVVRFLEATFFATFFFVRELGRPYRRGYLIEDHSRRSRSPSRGRSSGQQRPQQRHGQTRQLEFWSLRRRFCLRLQQFLARAF